jgi:thiol-disulfide isomerase/thioredoxin
MKGKMLLVNKFSSGLKVCLLAAVLSLAAACSANNSQNALAPDFSLKNLNGESVSLFSFNTPVLLNFWATTCPPCLAEMPHFQELYEDWSSRDDVAFLSINLGESSSTVKEYINSNHYSFPVLLDTGSAVSEKYQIRYIPTTLLVGKDREVKYRVVGPFKNKDSIMKAIGSYLE